VVDWLGQAKQKPNCKYVHMYTPFEQDLKATVCQHLLLFVLNCSTCSDFIVAVLKTQQFADTASVKFSDCLTLVCACRVLLEVDHEGFQRLFAEAIKAYDEERPKPAKRAREGPHQFDDSHLPPPGVCHGPKSCCGAAALAKVPVYQL